jgi:hypothetical protein
MISQILIIICNLLLLINCNINSNSDNETSCFYKNNTIYKNDQTWQDISNCLDCKCLNGVPFCQKQQCKYEPCQQRDQIFILNGNECCPRCSKSKRPCRYKSHLIDHNTEFSPNLCELCKCKDGRMECTSNCPQTTTPTSNKLKRNFNPFESTTPSTMIQKNNNKMTACFHNNQLYNFNTTWSPINDCTKCYCDYNSKVTCYVKECPSLTDCQQDEIHFIAENDSCCPVCLKKEEENYNCLDNKYKNGQYWTQPNDTCTHCTCQKGQIKCSKQNCTTTTTEECPKNEILIYKSNRCCPQCVSQVSDNCEYYGEMHYNGEMWYNSGCQHCACDYGKVVCVHVECESKFCLRDEIMVKKKDDCCVECRQAKHCSVELSSNSSSIIVKENEIWLPPPPSPPLGPSRCQLCECVEGELACFVNGCDNHHQFPSFGHINVPFNKSYQQINARTIPFFSHILKSMNKIIDTSTVFVIKQPKYGQLVLLNRKKRFQFQHQFKLSQIEKSKFFYKQNKDRKAEDEDVDYALIAIVPSQTRTVHSILIAFDLNSTSQQQQKQQLNSNERIIRGNSKLKMKKIINIHPDEDIKLTNDHLSPKLDNLNGLIYVLVSDRPKYGELKLKKTFTYDETVPGNGWTKVNDIYMEKRNVETFTQNDLNNGNVWYSSNSEDLTLPQTPLLPPPSPISNYQGLDRNGKNCQLKNDSILNNNSDDYNMIAISSNDDDCALDFTSYYYTKQNSNNKYDHLIFEVYDSTKTIPISKEIIHFNIENEIINETLLGLECIEGEIVALSFSNFEVAGIDSSRDYLTYRIIKSLDSVNKNQGQLEHVDKPGVVITTFSQADLNRGAIVYRAPTRIGDRARDFSFTFIVTNDNRSDTFPETPFHIRVVPANDEPPLFKSPVSHLKLMQGSSVTLSREIFDIEDADTSIDNLMFKIEKVPMAAVVELRMRGQRYFLSKHDSFTMQEVREGTFRLIHNNNNNNNDNSNKDTMKLSCSDGKHETVKTVYINLILIDKIAPQLATESNGSSLFLQLYEDELVTIRRDNLAFVDDKSPPEMVIFHINEGPLNGKLYLNNKELKRPLTFTQNDVDLFNLKYRAPIEIGAEKRIDSIRFDVVDRDGNVLKDQVMTIAIEPRNNQAPTVEILNTLPNRIVNVDEGGFFILNDETIRVRDVDTQIDELNLIIDSQPTFGSIENTFKKGFKLNSFPVSDLIDANRPIRYIQSDHKNKEPNKDSIIFHVSDGVNESPPIELIFKILPINDEMPIVVTNPLILNRVDGLITNETLKIIDFDTKPSDLVVFMDELPRNGNVYLNETIIINENDRFTYADIENGRVSFRFDKNQNVNDEIKLIIKDGDEFKVETSLRISLDNKDQLYSVITQNNKGLDNAIEGKKTTTFYISHIYLQSFIYLTISNKIVTIPKTITLFIVFLVLKLN